MTTNGTHTPAPAAAPAFDFDAWQRLTRAALVQGEQHLDAARREHAEAGAAIARMEQQMAILRRALALSPSATVTPTTTASLRLVPPPAAPALGPITSAAPSPARPAVVGAPPQILRGVRTGKGAGSQSAAYLLELARVRVAVKADRRVPGRRPGADGMAGVDLELDGGEALTPETVWLSCRGWAKSTVRDGLRRLMEDGLLERTAPGTYRLTHAGLAAGPSEAGMLPLREPVDDAREPEGVEA